MPKQKQKKKNDQNIHIQSKNNIKILTYNVFLRPPPIKTNQDDYKNQRLKDILQQIDKYDIVCFQELFQTASFRKQKVIQTAISKGFFYWKGCQPPSFWSAPPVDSGLLVISKYPILMSTFQSFKIGVLSDSASDKGYIYCKIEIKGNILHLFSTHLQASYLHPGMLKQRQLSIKTRLWQFRQLMNKINTLLTKYSNLNKMHQETVMLVGDLNMDALMRPVPIHEQTSVLFDQQVGQTFYQYDCFLKIFQDYGITPIDCGLHRYKKHPVTFGDGDVVLTELVQSQSKQRLDFIFQLYFKNGIIPPLKRHQKPAKRNTENKIKKQNNLATRLIQQPQNKSIQQPSIQNQPNNRYVPPQINQTQSQDAVVMIPEFIRNTFKEKVTDQNKNQVQFRRNQQRIERVSRQLGVDLENPARKSTVYSHNYQLQPIPYHRLVPLINTAKVEQFKIQNRVYTQLSDHYGFSIELTTMGGQENDRTKSKGIKRFNKQGQKI